MTGTAASADWRDNALAVALFMLPAASLAIPSGYSWGALLLCVLGTLAWRDSSPPVGTRVIWWGWGMAIAGISLLWLLPALMQTPFRLNSLDRPSKFALALLALPAAWRMRTHHARPLVLGMLTGVLTAAALAAWQIKVQGMSRAWGHTNAIHFGNLALLLGLWVWVWTRHGTPAIWQAAGRVALLAGLCTSIASEARGGWLMAPVLLALVLWLDRPAQASTKHWHHAATALLVIGGILSWQWSTISERTRQAWQEVQLHAQSGTNDTSIGQRLEHWKLAWQMGREKPLTGWGESGYQAEKQARATRGDIPALLASFGHAHNEWLEMWAKHGALGLSALILLLGVPGWVYATSWRRSITMSTALPPSDLCRKASISGLVLVIGYLGFGMTQVMLAHNSGVMMYLFMNLVFLGLINANSASSSPEPDTEPH